MQLVQVWEGRAERLSILLLMKGVLQGASPDIQAAYPLDLPTVAGSLQAPSRSPPKITSYMEEYDVNSRLTSFLVVSKLLTTL